MGTLVALLYSETFKSANFESVKVASGVEIKSLLKIVRIIQKNHFQVDLKMTLLKVSKSKVSE